MWKPRGYVVVRRLCIAGLYGLGAASLVCAAESLYEDVVPTVRPIAETLPVPTDDDAADDPAIWVNPTDPSASLIIGTDKKAGLGVYRLDGSLVNFYQLGPQNNVDIRSDVVLSPGFRAMNIVASSDREDHTFRLFELATNGSLIEVGARLFPTELREAYGICLHHSETTGHTHVFINDKGGRVEQWRLFAEGAPLRPRVGAALVRTFQVGGQPEGMTADDELGWLYVGEGRTGIWRYHAEPWTHPEEHPFSLDESDHEREPVEFVGPHGRLTADVEGVDIARMGDAGGLLLVSSQSADRFDVFERAYPYRFVGSFRIGAGFDASGEQIDAVTHTDGLAVCAGDVGPSLPGGVVVVQDDENPGGTQNFKIVPLSSVLAALGLTEDAERQAASVDATEIQGKEDATP